MNFEFAMGGNPSDELDRIRTEAAKSKIVFIGDSKEGTITGGISALGLSINGLYAIHNNKMTVTIHNKPTVRSWGQIRTMLTSMIEK